MGENSPEDYVPEHRAEDPVLPQGLMSNKLYDRLKFVALVVLPALALFYLTLAPIWGFPKQEEVAGSIVALDIFLGSLLGLSSKKHQEQVEQDPATVRDPQFMGGKIVYQDNGGNEPDVNLVMSGNPKDWEDKDQVVFKILPRNPR